MLTDRQVEMYRKMYNIVPEDRNIANKGKRNTYSCSKCGVKMVGYDHRLRSDHKEYVGDNTRVITDKSYYLCDECLEEFEGWLGEENYE